MVKNFSRVAPSISGIWENSLRKPSATPACAPRGEAGVREGRGGVRGAAAGGAPG